MAVLEDHDGSGDAAAGAPRLSVKTAGPGRQWARRLLAEPLLHFLILGVVLFGAYAVLQDRSADEQPLRIELTDDDLRQMAVMWLAQGRPLPTVDEMQSLVDQKVSEEILSREAVNLGLDRDDQIIKRRLAQKMDFLLADLATLQPPTRAELADWYAANGERFALPPHVSFRHLYYSFDREGVPPEEAARRALPEVNALGSDDAALAALADPFMFQSYYGDATPDQMAKAFGPGFATDLFALTPGSWQGPIQSGYGWHLVKIDSFETGRIPAFEEVEQSARDQWVNDRYLEIKARAFDEMRSRYTVVVPRIEDVDLGNLAAPASAGGPE
jgi:parvulin-like peptidyl-prolyl isomerase